ncbi:MAG: SpoIIE family protein phosphatase [Microscillaceae bacterium]|nr:SpoIIE family protein phosphatase [Microscillaceae bacterium]
MQTQKTKIVHLQQTVETLTQNFYNEEPEVEAKLIALGPRTPLKASFQASSQPGLRDPEALLTSTTAVRKNRDTLDSILYARQIQQALLPQLDVIQSVFAESFVLFKPRDMVSGDFYWFNSKSHLSVIGAVDCTGHGVPGAFLSMIGNELLNKIVIFKGISEPDRILNQLQLEMRNTLKQKENGNEDGMDIGLCTLHLVPEDRQEWFGPPRLEFAGARNHLIYIQDQQLRVIKGDKIPIGGYLYQEDHSYTRHVVPLHTSTRIYLFSDGFADQFGGPEKKKFMMGRFRELLFSIHQRPMPEQKELLDQQLRQWIGTGPQIDDVLVMGFLIIPPPLKKNSETES